MKKKILTILKISFSICLLYFIFKDIDLVKLIIGLKSVNILLLLFAFSLFYIATILAGYKLSFILDKNKIKYEIAKLNFILIFLNNFIPGSITSDIYKGYKLKKYFSTGKITFGILTDRVSGLLMLLIFFSLSGIYFFNFILNNFYINQKIIYIFLVLFILFILFILVFLIFKNKLLNISIVKDIIRSYKELTIKKILKVFIFTFFIRILTPIMFFIELISINPDFIGIPIYYIIFITTFTELINIIPITIKGYGIREFIWLALLTPFGVSVETIAILTILIILNDLIASSLGGFFFIKEKRS